MKKILLSMLFLLSLLTGFSQVTEKLNNALSNGLNLLDSAKTVDEFTNAANYFERIAKVESAEWLPHYYTAYSLLLSGISGKQDEEMKDAIYDKAMSYADLADRLKTNNSEIIALKGYIIFMKMAVSPQARAMMMIPQSNALIEKAISLDPENPRAHLLKGQNLFYTPSMFGGDKAQAKEVLELAAAKYAASKASTPEPSWGKRRCNELLKQIQNDQNN